MNNPLGFSPSKGKQGTTRGKEKSFYLGGNRTHDLRIRSTVTLPTELQGRTEKVGDDNIHMYPYFVFAAIHHLKSSPTFSPRLSLRRDSPSKIV